MELPKHTSIKVNNGVLNIIIDDTIIKESYSFKHARIFLSDSNGNAMTDKETIYNISNTLYNELFLNKNNIDVVPRRMLLKSTSVDKTCLYKCVGRRIDIILSLNRHVIGTLSDGSLAIVSKSALTEECIFNIYDDYIEPSFNKWLNSFNKCSAETKRQIRKKYYKESINHDIKHIVVYTGDKHSFDNIDNYTIVPKYVYYIFHLNDNIIKNAHNYSIVGMSHMLRMMELQDFSINYTKVKFLGSTLQVKNRYNLCISITSMLLSLCKVGNTKRQREDYINTMERNISKLTKSIGNLGMYKSVDIDKRVYFIWQRAVYDNRLCKEYADNYSLFNHHFATRLKMYDKTTVCSLTEEGLNVNRISPQNIISMNSYVLNSIDNSILTKYMTKDANIYHDDKYPLYVNHNISANITKVIPRINQMLIDNHIDTIRYLSTTYSKPRFIINLNDKTNTLIALSIRAIVSILTYDIRFKDKSLVHYYVPRVLVNYFKDYSDCKIEIVLKISKIICEEIGEKNEN